MKKQKINLIKLLICGIIIILVLLYVVITSKISNSKQINSSKFEKNEESPKVKTDIIEEKFIDENEILIDDLNESEVSNTLNDENVLENKVYKFDELNIINPDGNKLVEFSSSEVRDLIEITHKILVNYEANGPIGLLEDLGFINFEENSIETESILKINGVEHKLTDTEYIRLTNIKFDDFLSKLFVYFDPNYYVTNFSCLIYSVDGYVAYQDFGSTGYEISIGNIIKKDGISNDYYVEYQSGEFDYPETVSTIEEYVTINSYEGHAVLADREYIN